MKRQWDRLLFFACLAFLSIVIAFGAGMYVADRHKFPYFQVRIATIAAICNYGLEFASVFFKEKHKKYPFVWASTRETTTGVVIHDPSRTFRGYTLITDNDTSARLIDMQGNVIHQWCKPFSEVWPQPKHVEPLIDPVPRELIYWQRAFLFPNGDLIAIYAGPFAPYGAGIARLNARSGLIWKADINAHHDLAVAEDGRIITLTHKYNYEQGRPRIDDTIVVLSPDGTVLNQAPIYEVVKKSPYYYLIPDAPYGDYLHTNNIELLTSDKASGFPFLKAGDILLSHREAVGITVVDAETMTVKWALTGVASSVHDADYLENGRIVFFENKAYRQGSQVLEWDCTRNQPGWRFTPADYAGYFAQSGIYPQSQDGFFSYIGGRQQKLPNGNYLIVETTGGTVFEVTPEKEVVWKYVSTHFDGESIGMVYDAQRYAPDDLPFILNHP
ncbi:MAG: arylsulfotransferase family protein [Thermodesulfobacteriota bacterium]